MTEVPSSKKAIAIRYYYIFICQRTAVEGNIGINARSYNDSDVLAVVNRLESIILSNVPLHMSS